MPLKRMAEFKRDDYAYTSPDGDDWQITLVQNDDRKYVEIKKADGESEVTWDIEMLLDIADAIRSASRQAVPNTNSKKHKLQSPSIVDHRDAETPADHIHAVVTESMEQVGDTSTIPPVESFTKVSTIAEDVARRTGGAVAANPESKVKRANL